MEEPTPSPRPRPSVTGLLGKLQAARTAAARPAVARTLTALALVALAWGSWTALDALPADQEIDWVPLAVAAAVATPLGVALNALEYRLSAHAVDVAPSWSAALRISIYGTAANLLPVPGSSLIRIDAIAQSGAGYRRATLSTIGVGFVWLGVALILAGAIGASSEPGLSLVFVLAGAVPLVTAIRLFSRAGAPTRVVVAIGATQIASVTVQAFRLYVAIDAVGADATVARAFALGVSVVVASAAGFLPGGLGIRELGAALLGPMIGLTAAETFLATVLDRAASLAAVAIVAVVVLVATRGEVGRLVEPELRDGGARDVPDVADQPGDVGDAP